MPQWSKKIAPSFLSSPTCDCMSPLSLWEHDFYYSGRRKTWNHIRLSSPPLFIPAQHTRGLPWVGGCVRDAPSTATPQQLRCTRTGRAQTVSWGRALMAPGTRAQLWHHRGAPREARRLFPHLHTQLQYPQHVLAQKPTKQIFTVRNTGEKRSRGTFCEGLNTHTSFAEGFWFPPAYSYPLRQLNTDFSFILFLIKEFETKLSNYKVNI